VKWGWVPFHRFLSKLLFSSTSRRLGAPVCRCCIVWSVLFFFFEQMICSHYNFVSGFTWSWPQITFFSCGPLNGLQELGRLFSRVSSSGGQGLGGPISKLQFLSKLRAFVWRPTKHTKQSMHFVCGRQTHGVVLIDCTIKRDTWIVWWKPYSTRMRGQQVSHLWCYENQCRCGSENDGQC
jgi:hypothetical protein